MSADLKTSFVKYYIRSLAERTRVEKTGTKFGFDWIIYNLALADELVPVRLPFFAAVQRKFQKRKLRSNSESTWLSCLRIEHRSLCLF